MLHPVIQMNEISFGNLSTFVWKTHAVQNIRCSIQLLYIKPNSGKHKLCERLDVYM